MPLSSKHLREHAELHAERASSSTVYKLLFGGKARRESKSPRLHSCSSVIRSPNSNTLFCNSSFVTPFIKICPKFLNDLPVQYISSMPMITPSCAAGCKLLLCHLLSSLQPHYVLTIPKPKRVLQQLCIDTVVLIDYRQFMFYQSLKCFACQLFLGLETSAITSCSHCLKCAHHLWSLAMTGSFHFQVGINVSPLKSLSLSVLHQDFFFLPVTLSLCILFLW